MNNNQSVRLADMSLIGAGQGAPQQPSDFGNTGEAFIRAGSLEALCDGGSLAPLERVNKEVAKRYKLRLYPADTVVFAKSGMSATKNRIYRLPKPCYVVNHLATIEPSAQLDALFLRYFLESFNPTHLIKDLSYPSISQEHIGDVQMQLPDLPEQKRIAALLQKADRLRRTRRYARQLSDTFLQSVFLEMFGDLLSTSRNWSIATVGDIGRVQLGRQRAPKYQTGKYRRPYMRVANVYENKLELSDVLSMDFNESDFREYRLEYGDILLNEGQSTELVGRPAMWREEIPDCCFQNTLIRFQADRTRVVPEYALQVFLRYLRDGEFAKVSAKTSNVAHLGARRFADMKFVIPPLPLQQKFAGIVRRFEHLRAQQREAERQAGHLFQTLLHRAFTTTL